MRDVLRLFAPALLASLCAAPLVAAPPDVRPPAEPAKITVSLNPAGVLPGDRAEVVLNLTPQPGVKINRYPKIKLAVSGKPGLVVGGETALGNDTPPPIDQAAGNYFERIDPLRLDLRVEPQASRGRHELQGSVTYFYCVTASGFCAPSRTPIKLALEVR